MELTFAEFKKLISLYQKNLLTNENLVYEDLIVPFSSVVEVASIYEDSTIDIDEKNYLVEKCFYEAFNCS